jgi:hypothetical protein
MDDNGNRPSRKGPRLDPLFGDILKNIMIPPRRTTRDPIGMFEGPSPEQLARAMEDLGKDCGDPDCPVHGQGKGGAELREILRDLIGGESYKPTSPAQEKLARETAYLGFRVVTGKHFACDYLLKRIVIVPTALEAELVVAWAHELGHATRFAAGRLDMLSQMKIGMSGRKDLPPHLRRFMVSEEILAWRLGLSILRRLAIPVPKAITRRLRMQTVDSYRHNQHMPNAFTRNASRRMLGAL